MLDARTEDAVVVSRPGNGGLVDENVPSLKRKRKGRSNREVVNNCCHCRFRKSSTTHATRCRKSSPLLTTELVGWKSMETIKKICNYLMEDEIVTIGIYGMGGVGKTAILMHVHNKVLENPAFNNVFWVTIPQEFSICELQDEIANAVGLDNLSKDRDTKRRASILNRHLKKKRAVLMLDGLWMHFDYEDVGIPVEMGGIKLVLTTRSLDVCHKMLCQEQIEIRPLHGEDDHWDLFLKKLCFGRDLPLEVEKIARSILDKCKGLPLGIVEIATLMRGVEVVCEWKDLLQKVENSKMELNVLEKLKLSYKNLGNPQVQQCFLHLVLCFGESKHIIIDKVLIESFIDEGLLSGIATRYELHDKGKIILDKIKRACLVFDVCGKYVSVHPLIRDMALQIVTGTTHMVKANMGLKEIPKEEFWTDHLEKVFLQINDIKEIPFGISPNCPKLTRLSLNNNMFLEAIHESFFRHLNGLKVLDLNNTGLTELPDSISHLESLEALLLQGCKKLRQIPCVRNLGSLRKLVMSGCAMLKEVPEGMEMLVKLSYLDLHDTLIETLSEGLLGKLVNLQYVVVGRAFQIVEEKVEALYCYVSNVETFNAWVRFLEQNSSRPYELRLNESGAHFFEEEHKRCIIIKSCHSIAAKVDGKSGGDGHVLLPKNVQALKVEWCNGVTSLCEVGPLDNLEELEIKEWEKLEELGDVHFFPNLRRLNITGCSELKHLLKEGHELRRLQWFKIEDSKELEGINIRAPFLYNIEVYSCPKMKRVVEWEWLLTCLPQLRSIIIKNCEKLEEMIGGSMSIIAIHRLRKIEIKGCNNLQRPLMTHDMLLYLPFLQHVAVRECKAIEVIIGTSSNLPQSFFFNLINLTLSYLPELKSICEGTMICHSIRYMEITKCPKLRGFSAWCRPRTDDDDDIRIDRLTWQSLEWDHQCPFQPSLQHLARSYGVSNYQRICKCIKSCDAITARIDGQISGDGCNLLPRNVQVLKVGGGSGVTSLSEVGPLENLEVLTINRWEKLEELGAVHFPQLQGLNINWCFKLKRLSVEGWGLPHLHWFAIGNSQELEVIDLAAPNLKFMEVWSCRKMKRVVEWDWLITRLLNLNSIRISFCEKLEKIVGGPLPIGATCLLTEIGIESCNNMKGVLLTHDMLPHIRYLHHIRIKDCKGIKVIIGTAPNMTQPSFPKLARLVLENLPELKRICDRMESCDHIQYIKIYKCPKLKRIPLRLCALDNGLLSPPLSLGKIWIDRETWQALEWDLPLARVSLEPFIEFFGLSYQEERRWLML
ncbi:hypothetical protein EUGRSUZ_F00830 [Eucalyptus grandis]|uniref:Uncharacterized protein n=1 Tax=Eucalyptus grandis TaxID=71139 RepID=A0ACC3KCS3_EUCGR|nr:hypothetical protein EUGRSUZ_F00830 [Eucalyptus grandis]